MCILLKWYRWLVRCWKKEKRTEDIISALDKATVQQAGLELRQAYQVLAEVEDPDMVDYAVFTLQAAEKRYGYLVKKLKEQERQADSFNHEMSGSRSIHCVEG